MGKYGFGLMIGLLVTACAPPPGSQPGSSNAPAQPSGQQVIQQISDGVGEMSTEYREMSRPGKVQAWVDNLIVKEQPGKEMPQVAIMKEGEMAEYLYQRTIRKTEINLRSQRFYEPWILIRTQAGVMGWVHEGGVKFVSPGMDALIGTNNTDPNARTRSMPGTPSAGDMARDFLIVPGKRLGAITLTTSETDLINLYGADNVGRSVVMSAGNKKEDCTVVFAQAREELRITWTDANRIKIKAIYLLYPNSKWVTAQGMQVGISLSELVKINHAPIAFYGFNWDYSGTIVSWKAGALFKYEKHFYAVVAPRKPQNVATLLEKFKGNKEFTSNTEGVENLDLYVERIVVYMD